MSAESKRKLGLLDTLIDGKRLGDVILDWHKNTETQALIAQAIEAGQITAIDASNAQRYATDPFDPTNKPKFELIPEGVACQDCSHLEKVIAIDMEHNELSVVCSNEKKAQQKVLMKVIPLQPGGALAIEGRCLNNYNGIKNKPLNK